MKLELICLLAVTLFEVTFGHRQLFDSHHHDVGRQRTNHNMRWPTRGRSHDPDVHMDSNRHEMLQQYNMLSKDFRRGHGHQQKNIGEPCPSVCSYDYQPVCGSDGRTYSNKCELSVEGCRKGKRMYVEKEGIC